MRGERGAVAAVGNPRLLHVARSGAGDPPLVLTHGFGASGRYWQPWLPALEAKHEVLNVDLTGFGQAPMPRGVGLAPEDQARRIAALVRELAPRAPVLVGHSFGAGVIALAALELLDEGAPNAPAGLVFMSGAIYPQKLPPFMTLGRVPLVGDLLLALAPPRPALRAGLRGIAHRKEAVTPERAEDYRIPLEHFGRRRAILAAARAVRLETAEALAARIDRLRIPTLLLWGEEDPVIPCDHGRRLARELPEARLETFPGIGHLVIDEAGDLALAPLLTFLAELAPRR